eukprot:365677-Chlamydomonas_euryale.AAC.4
MPPGSPPKSSKGVFWPLPPSGLLEKSCTAVLRRRPCSLLAWAGGGCAGGATLTARRSMLATTRGRQRAAHARASTPREANFAMHRWLASSAPLPSAHASSHDKAKAGANCCRTTSGAPATPHALAICMQKQAGTLKLSGQPVPVGGRRPDPP